MTHRQRVVPWFSVKEWLDVYNNLYSEISTIHHQEIALKNLLVWKARCPFLPSGIESTLSLLEVYVHDTMNRTDNDQIIRLAYSSAIMRFINHMFDVDAAKGHSLYQVAQNRGVPDWIVDLRHDTAHSNNLPSIELLREATSISLQWLHDNYWIIHKDIIKDCVINKNVIMKSLPEEKIIDLINFCTTLSFCANSNCKIKNLAQMPQNLKQSLMRDAQHIFQDKVNVSNLEQVSVQSLISQLNIYANHFFKKIDKGQVIKVLVDKETLILSPTVYEVMSKDKYKTALNNDYKKCFEGLLKFLSSHNFLEDFVMELIKITQLEESCSKRKKLAALWVSEILKAIRKTQIFFEKVTELNIDLHYKSNKELQSLYYHWFPNERSSLILDFRQPVPSSLTDMDVIRPIISTYNPYLNYFINDLLQLIKPKLCMSVIQKICTLAELIASPEKFPAESNKIYTVEDLKINESKVIEVSEDCSITIENDNNKEYGIWKRASHNHDWSTCPIGLLPWQKQQTQTETTMETD